jgi:hypothetical protein
MPEIRSLQRLFRRLAMAFLALALLAHAGISSAVDEAATLERNVKAASIYRFLSYVEWPQIAFADANSPYVIGVMGAEGLAEELARISTGRNVNNRPLQVRRLRSGDSVNGLHVLFLGRDTSDLSQTLKQVQTKPVLSVTEDETQLPPGSVINFRIVNNRVRFEIALGTAEKNSLKVSSRMLPIAFAVYPGEQP